MVKINTKPEKTIIYLDPPYKNTSKYQKDVNFEKLENWIKDSKYKIYVSSYEWDLPLVRSFKHRSTLSSTSNKEVVENLFCNKGI